jgi:hypothetical protein
MTGRKTMPDQPGPPYNDLIRITGIDGEIAARLRDAGIGRVDELARATVEQVVAACGDGVATNARAQGWIKLAAELVYREGSGVGPEASGETRLLPRRTFTVEVWVDSDAAEVITTRVVHLETQDADAWPGWRPAHLLDFIEARTGLADSQHSGAGDAADTRKDGPTIAGPGALAAADCADDPLSPAALVVYRFGLLRAPEPVVRRGKIAVRLRLNAADLDLPASLTAAAHVELLAQPLGAGRAEVLDRSVIDVTGGSAVDTVLRGPLPDRNPPFAILAIVRVLVDQPSSRPREDLGSATLEVISGSGGVD